jgi:hypothetical protein
VDYIEIPLYKILYFVRGTTTGGIKQMGTHNRSENGCGAWVALCSYPSHTNTDIYPPPKKKEKNISLLGCSCSFWDKD